MLQNDWMSSFSFLPWELLCLPEANVYAYVNALFSSMFLGENTSTHRFSFSLLWMHVNPARCFSVVLLCFAHFISLCSSPGLKMTPNVWEELGALQQKPSYFIMCSFRLCTSCGTLHLLDISQRYILMTNLLHRVLLKYSKIICVLPGVSSLCTDTEQGWLGSSALIMESKMGGRWSTDKSS